ncbi:MAG: Gfo/Idh/MocA family oxidoreductase [Lentisphaeria bacterium]|nr:Gfo/Idh/MocA family oxidoreductase [Lentisphaeria bacterium]
MKYKVAVLGLRMGGEWAKAALALPNAELCMVYDPAYGKNERIDTALLESRNIKRAMTEEEVYESDADVVVVASPDHFHAEQSVKALKAGKHVACEKPLAPTLEDCRKIIEAVKSSGKQFMTGQVCRYAPGFRTAKALFDAGRIGELTYVESEYAHDYHRAPGYENWRKDPAIKRQGFLGGGCHALDLTRWIAGDPLEVSCFMNHKFMPDWPTPDTGVAIAKFPDDVIGRVFVSIGVQRPYTMRTCLYGTKGTIICDNTSPQIQICESTLLSASGKLDFTSIPVAVASHNVTSELREFLAYIEKGEPCPTDVYQGTKTVAFAEAAIRSAENGAPVKPDYDF